MGDKGKTAKARQKVAEERMAKTEDAAKNRARAREERVEAAAAQSQEKYNTLTVFSMVLTVNAVFFWWCGSRDCRVCKTLILTAITINPNPESITKPI